MGAMATGVEMVEKEQAEQLLADVSYKSAEFGPIGHGCEPVFEGKFTLPPPVAGRDQLQALLRRQWLHKVHDQRILLFIPMLCLYQLLQGHNGSSFTLWVNLGVTWGLHREGDGSKPAWRYSVPCC